ncbi:MAG TPA: PqqD family protein [Bryobacteraceae bacterium]|nr:PqqD family protein [Candidatus Binataceae bacterium]HUA84923.1 PqqD family protein [Bryobacteraceae bacterium]
MSDKYIARSKAVAARVLGGEMMIMSAADSRLFSLSDVATVIWEAADGRTPLAEIVEQRICAEFDVPPDVAYRDAEHLVEELATRGILSISTQPIAEAVAGRPAAEAP